MSGNEAWNRNVLSADGRLTETGQIMLSRDSRQFHGRYQQTIGPSRAEGTSTRPIGVVFIGTFQKWRTHARTMVRAPVSVCRLRDIRGCSLCESRASPVDRSN